MKLSRTDLSFIIAMAILSIAALGCNFSLGKGGGNSSSAITSDNSSDTAKAAETPDSGNSPDISGKYTAIGTNPNGGGQYKADLLVTKRDEVYQFSWLSGKSSFDGVGVMTNDVAAVSYTDGENGKGCGVVLYDIAANGDLSGKAGYWGVNSAESEKAVRKNGSGLEGDYDINGRTPDGKDYKGKLNVKKAGEGYKFSWDVGGTLDGFGIQVGNKAAVGFGGKQCLFVAYTVAADGTLNGKWGGFSTTTFGSETASKIEK